MTYLTKLLTFAMSLCENYFSKVLSVVSTRRLAIPSWFPVLNKPSIQFDESVPSYKEVTTAIRRSRSRSSSGLWDRLSILILKNCPMARTILHWIISECWKSNRIPVCWKNSATILIHKKDSTADPSNFRPISLQSVWYKILASIMKQRLYKFLCNNDFIDEKIQKGFWPKSDGVSEHSEMLGHIIRDAKKRSRSVIITLLDLRNAFGEVHHNLINACLQYHHVPELFTKLFNDIYKDSTNSFSFNRMKSNPIKI